MQKRLYRAPLADRLLFRSVLTETGCREYTGWRNQSGYGRIKVAGKMPYAHRVAYEVWVGPVPEGLCVCHHCDNPACINPDHLFVGTATDNMRDMWAKGRGNITAARNADRGAGMRAAADRRRAAAAESAGYPPDHKRCSRCQTFKPPESFGLNRRRPDNLQTYCRPCRFAYLGRSA